MVVGGSHDLIPQRACFELSVDPLAFVVVQKRTRLLLGNAWLSAMDQRKVAVGLHRVHEFISDADRNVEVAQVAFVLGVNEFFNVGVITTQHAHLRPTARASGLYGFARAVKHPHVAHRARGAALGAAYPSTMGADA